MIMVCAQVIGNDTAITLGGLYGNFELNVMLPLIARNLLEQITLLGNVSDVFVEKLLDGLSANRKWIESRNEQSLSLATVLAPRIGYDKAAEIAKRAHRQGETLREAALALGYVTADEFDAWVRPETMTGGK
jgi:fumarate hydratase class II